MLTVINLVNRNVFPTVDSLGYARIGQADFIAPRGRIAEALAPYVQASKLLASLAMAGLRFPLITWSVRRFVQFMTR